MTIKYLVKHLIDKIEQVAFAHPLLNRVGRCQHLPFFFFFCIFSNQILPQEKGFQKI